MKLNGFVNKLVKELFCEGDSDLHFSVYTNNRFLLMSNTDGTIKHQTG